MYNTRREGLEFGIKVAEQAIADLEPEIKKRRVEKNFTRANELIAQQNGARSVLRALKKELAVISPKK